PEHVVAPLVLGVEPVTVHARWLDARRGGGAATQQPADRGALAAARPVARLARSRAEARSPEHPPDMRFGPASVSPPAWHRPMIPALRGRPGYCTGSGAQTACARAGCEVVAHDFVR